MSISRVVRDKNGKEHRVGNYAHVKKFRQNKKRALVEKFGGKCVICNYNKSIRNLSFHHVDPKTKSFGISTGGHRYSLDKVFEEAKKCILVCANCHGEIHDGLVDANDYYKSGTPDWNCTNTPH